MQHDITLSPPMADIEEILADRARARERYLHSQNLVKKYKKLMPDIASKWDKTPASVPFNDICTSITSSGLSIYSCKMDELWKGLYMPSIYEANTLWKSSHDSGKIAGVIDAWANGTGLSPIFLVKHEVHEQGLVADGKHRLTVARAISALEVPFMVETTKAEWISLAFPSAICVHQIEQSPPPNFPALTSLR